MADRLLLALKGVTVAGAVATGAIVATPPAVSVTPVAPVIARTRTAPAAVPDSSPEAAALVVATNVFSPTREAPDERTYAGDGDGAWSDDDDAATGAGDVAFDGGMPASDSTSTAAEDPVPHLYGIVQGPAGEAALLRLDRAGKGGRLFRIGDGAGGWRVASIGTEQVTLAGAGGTRVLRLARRTP
jgi:hypothetical protein